MLYLLWMVWDRNTPLRTGRPSLAFRRSPVFRAAASYFPAELHVPAGGLDPTVRHIFAFHPHGIISTGAVLTLATEALDATRQLFPSVAGTPAEAALVPRFLTVSANFVMPLWREIVLAAGFVSATRESAEACLHAGHNIVVVPGGALESLNARPGNADLTLVKRRGFIRLALVTGAALVPVYSFGENELYGLTVPVAGSWISRLQLHAVKVLGFTVPLFHGRGVVARSSGLLPRRIPLHTVVGPALPARRLEAPTEEDVDTLHEEYCIALRALYSAHAHAYFEEARSALHAEGQDVSSLTEPPPLRIVA